MGYIEVRPIVPSAGKQVPVLLLCLPLIITFIPCFIEETRTCWWLLLHKQMNYTQPSHIISFTPLSHTHTHTYILKNVTLLDTQCNWTTLCRGDTCSGQVEKKWLTRSNESPSPGLGFRGSTRLVVCVCVYIYICVCVKCRGCYDRW